MNNVAYLPASRTMTAEQAINSALGLDFSEVIIIGFDSEGDFLVRSSRMTNADALWLAELLKKYAMADIEVGE